ncbi:hypothetical protein RvY_01168 [Ramazzottius varieornatus]|uniref:Uncharacterized protein n=1 Tax=Ramazzottius varieornatus TaxID=947166 RepID=A0A1D1UJB4_RAMVA|nr:hypothetical protein RvY_01168 [Ramazzottius varieornatus]
MKSHFACPSMAANVIVLDSFGRNTGQNWSATITYSEALASVFFRNSCRLQEHTSRSEGRNSKAVSALNNCSCTSFRAGKTRTDAAPGYGRGRKGHPQLWA